VAKWLALPLITLDVRLGGASGVRAGVDVIGR